MSLTRNWGALPILKGPLKGKRWLIATRINFFLGTYEVEQTEAFVKTVRENDIVYDCGAHYGYYTLLASTLAPQGKVIAFEPSPANLVHLHRHLEMNHCANVTVLESALGDRVGTAQFDNRTGSASGISRKTARCKCRSPRSTRFSCLRPLS